MRPGWSESSRARGARVGRGCASGSRAAAGQELLVPHAWPGCERSPASTPPRPWSPGSTSQTGTGALRAAGTARRRRPARRRGSRPSWLAMCVHPGPIPSERRTEPRGSPPIRPAPRRWSGLQAAGQSRGPGGCPQACSREGLRHGRAAPTCSRPDGSCRSRPDGRSWQRRPRTRPAPLAPRACRAGPARSRRAARGTPRQAPCAPQVPCTA
mmetsp:Transcript_20545/g.52048  ORF Transcript_20545/g.52048 Transcript_20545/m.52048 type:complete len:212 (-) Transcript_20545:78-713(-)